MNEIISLDLKEFVFKSINEVFETMFSMKILCEQEFKEDKILGNKLVGSVSFAGKASGNINIQVSDEFAKIMTAAMLGIDVDEVLSDDEIHDVIGETSNMVGGNLKSRLCDAGLPCELSIPSITSGKIFRIESVNWIKHEKLFFRNKQHTFIVEVFIKHGA